MPGEFFARQTLTDNIISFLLSFSGQSSIASTLLPLSKKNQWGEIQRFLSRKWNFFALKILVWRFLSALLIENLCYWSWTERSSSGSKLILFLTLFSLCKTENFGCRKEQWECMRLHHWFCLMRSFSYFIGANTLSVTIFLVMQMTFGFSSE